MASRRFKRLLLGFVAGLVALEFGLQVLALGAAWFTTRADVGGDGAAGDGPVVLCVGDSLTFGLGAERDEAWPARMVANLASEIPGLRVVNEARPGQTSADVLERLRPQLAELRPDVVCCLVGWNDTWSRPPAMRELPTGRSAFRWRWRTGQLLELAFAKGPDALNERGEEHGDPVEPAAEAGSDVVGAWHVGAQDFAFLEDGSGLFGGLAVRWERTPRGVMLTHDDPGIEPYELLIRARGSDEILIQHPRWARFVLARRGLSADRTPLQIAQDRLAAGDPSGAQEILEGMLTTPDQHDARGALLGMELPEDRREEHLRVLRAAWQDGAGALPAGVALATATLAAVESGSAQRDAGVRVAMQVLAREPTELRVWRSLVDVAQGDEALKTRLRKLLRDALGTVQDTALECSLLLLESRIGADAEVALEALDAAAWKGVVVTELTNAVRQLVRDGWSPDDLRVGLHEAQHRALRLALRRALASDRQVQQVLRQHFDVLARACEGVGARLVLIGYPFRMDDHQATVRAAAAAHDVPFVELRSHFDEFLESDPWSVWFADEIHCTARGYAEMAARIGVVVGSLLNTEKRRAENR